MSLLDPFRLTHIELQRQGKYTALQISEVWLAFDMRTAKEVSLPELLNNPWGLKPDSKGGGIGHTLGELEDMASGRKKYDAARLSLNARHALSFLKVSSSVVNGLSRVKPNNKEQAELLETLRLSTELRELGRQLIENIPEGWVSGNIATASFTLHEVATRWKLDELPAPRETGIIRMAKTVNDHLLKAQGEGQLQFTFDDAPEEWKDAMLASGMEFFQAGLNFTPEQNAFIDTLYVMIHSQSVNTVDKEAEDYYKGGWLWSGEPAIRFSYTELARAYNGGKKPSEPVIESLRQTIQSLDGKRFFFSYQWGKRKTNTYAALFTLEEDTVTDEGGKDSNRRWYIVPHRFVINSIASRYIELPDDIRARVQKAFGKASHTDYQLRAYLLNEVSSNRKTETPPIDLRTAYERFTKKGTRPARQRELLNKALEGCKRLGLLASYEETTGKAGQPQIVFKIDRDWSRKPMPMLEVGEKQLR